MNLVKTVPSPVGTVYRMKPATMSTAPVLMDVMQDMKEPTVHKVNQFKRVILFQRKWHFLGHMSNSVTVSYATGTVYKLKRAKITWGVKNHVYCIRSCCT